MAREKTWQFDMNRAYVPAARAALDLSKYYLWYYKAFLTGQIGACFTVLASTITVATPGAAGSLADGTYYYQVTVLNGGSESVGSNEVPAVVSAGGTGSVALTWTAVAGATGYRVYRGTSAAGESVYYAPGNVTSYTDTGAVSTGGTPPAIGTWTLLGSSDATTAGMDGLDRWTNAYTAGKINRNTAGSAHSWVVLRSPVMNTKTYFLLLDWISSNDYAITFSLGNTNVPTGGTTTNGPTVQNPASLANINFCTNIATTSVKMHGALATDGSFNILTSRDFSMKFMSGFMCHLLADYKATDSYSVWISVAADITAQTPGTGTGFGGAVGGFDSNSNATMRYPNNLDFGFYGLIVPDSGNTPVTADAFDGSFVDFPVLVASKAANNITIRGRLQDIYFSPYTLGVNVPNQGSVNDPSTPEYMTVGVWWFPTNAIPNIY